MSNKSNITTVRLDDEENKQLEELAEFFSSTKSDVLVDGMRMVRDLKLVIQDLIRKDPELANVLRDNIFHLLFNTEFRRDRVGEVAENVLIGLMKKDMFRAGSRANLILRLFNTASKQEKGN